MSETNDKAIEFIANNLSNKAAQDEGYVGAPRWGCLRDDLKNKFLGEAKLLVAEWHNDERKALLDRKPISDLLNNATIPTEE
jgi:hypothetical protein